MPTWAYFVLFEVVDKSEGKLLLKTQRHLIILPLLLSFICALGNELLGAAARR